MAILVLEWEGPTVTSAQGLCWPLPFHHQNGQIRKGPLLFAGGPGGSGREERTDASWWGPGQRPAAGLRRAAPAARREARTQEDTSA